MSNRKRPLTDEELRRVVEDEEYYDFFDNESDKISDSDHETVDSNDSNSLHDYTDDDDRDTAYDENNCFLGKDKTTKWMKLPPSTASSSIRNNSTNLPGPKSFAKKAKTVYEAFALFFDDFVYNLLVENTNIHIESKVHNYSRSRDAKPVTANEMKAFIGLLIVAGVMRLSHLNYKDLFSKDGFVGSFFYKTMSSQRFLFILSCIRFNDLRTHEEHLINDQLTPIRKLFDNIITKYSNFFTPSQYVTFDEQLVGYRGNCSFRQCMPSKPSRYGIKLFGMCDATNFYTINMEVYLGRQPEGPYIGYSPQEIVARLLKPIDKSGRNITTSDRYTSIPLANLLLTHNLTTVGMLRKNKKEIPSEFLPNKNKGVKRIMFGFTESATLVSYTPKKSKSILLLSTMHHDGAIDVKTDKEEKPEILTFYNMTKGGVDTTDKLCATYNVGRRSRRWPLTLFFHLINVCAINAYVIYTHNQGNTKLDRRTFLKQLGQALVKDHQITRLDCPQIPRKIRKLLDEQSETEQKTEIESSTNTRKRCHICPRSANRVTTRVCSHCRKNVCGEHTRHLCTECCEV